MRKTRLNEKQREDSARKIRKAEITAMSENKPASAAQRAFRRPAYQSIDVLQYLRKKYRIGEEDSGQVGAD